MVIAYPKHPGLMDSEKMHCKPDWTVPAVLGETDRVLYANARDCYKKIAYFILSKLDSPSEVEYMVKEFYDNAVLHSKKTQKKRVQFIVEKYITETVGTDEKENRPGCIQEELLEDFKEDVTLSDEEARKAAERLAERLIDLLKKLGQNAKAEKPRCS